MKRSSRRVCGDWPDGASAAERNPKLLTSRIIKDVHDRQLRDLEAGSRLGEAQSGGFGLSLRQVLGRSLIQFGTVLTTDCPPQAAARR